MNETIILLAFIVWSFPLGFFRNKFRKMAYRTDDWKINIKPVFVRELKVLFGFEPLNTPAEKKLRNQYAVYLVVYLFLLYFVLF